MDGADDLAVDGVGAGLEGGGSGDGLESSGADGALGATDASAAGAMSAQGAGTRGGTAKSAQEDYSAAIAERDARISELEAAVAEASRTAEAAEALRAEIDELRRQGDEQRTDFELRLAGARSVRAARALLDERGGDVAALKEAEPWLFAPAPAAASGKTGLPSMGAASDDGAQVKRWRRIAGLDEE